MNYKYIWLIAVAACILFITSFAFSATEHCWRQNIARTVSPTPHPGTLLFADPNGDYNYIGPIGSNINYSGFGVSVIMCDDGASSKTNDYFDLYDELTGIILRTNSDFGGPNMGPAPGPGKACVYGTPPNQTLCYREGATYIPGWGDCSQSSMGIGMGTQNDINFSFDKAGEYTLTLRLGARSPITQNPYDPGIMLLPKLTLKFKIGTPSLLIFGQESVKKINSFDNNGMLETEILFTLLNKSPFTEIITSYNINCGTGATCEVDSAYNNFEVGPNSAMVIPGKLRFNKSTLPKSVAVSLQANYKIKDLAICDFSTADSICSTSSIPTIIESGLLDTQDFQVEVVGQANANNCIASDGTVGRTGEAVAPKVNLYFGGSVSPSAPSATSPIISMDECSLLEYNLTNPNTVNADAVYCSQKEFLVQLAERIGAISLLRKDIRNLESNGDFAGANQLKAQEALISNFDVYLRKQNLAGAGTSADNLAPTLFGKLGLQSGIFDNLDRFKSLIHGISFFKTIDNIRTTLVDISPGVYSIKIDLNEIEQVNTMDSYLFPTSGDSTLNPLLDIKVDLEKKEDPKYNWFFYNDESTEDFPLYYDGLTQPEKYVTNVSERGLILKYDSVSSTNVLYKTYATPLIFKIDANSNYVGNNSFTVSNYVSSGSVNSSPYDIFSFWTGVASTVGEGCFTTSTVSGVDPNLPYRIPDTNIGRQLNPNKFEVSEFGTVLPDSNIYLETVVYLPVTQSTYDVELSSKGKQFFTQNETCTLQGGSCKLKIKSTNSTHKITTLGDVFDAIKNGSVCVFSETGLGRDSWVLFWNENEIVQDLNTFKSTIKDAKICVN